ncbi:MAG: hypothetical protein LBQ54_12360 [Planctomycetaceae bacterium]|nr:hypothetical protein [Planctomycetaceae bacterium]
MLTQAAGNMRTLHPGWDCRPENQTRSRWSLESIDGKTLPLEAEGNCGEAARFPAPVGR